MEKFISLFLIEHDTLSPFGNNINEVLHYFFNLKKIRKSINRAINPNKTVMFA